MRRSLHITVKKAKNLKSSDSNGFADPYVEVKVLDVINGEEHQIQKFTTSVVQKNLNPKWEEEFKTSKINVFQFSLTFKFDSNTTFIKLTVKNKKIIKDEVCGFFFLFF
jgi:Ca2+-dependent lipid-binding protein